MTKPKICHMSDFWFAGPSSSAPVTVHHPTASTYACASLAVLTLAAALGSASLLCASRNHVSVCYLSAAQQSTWRKSCQFFSMTVFSVHKWEGAHNDFHACITTGFPVPSPARYQPATWHSGENQPAAMLVNCMLQTASLYRRNKHIYVSASHNNMT